MQVFIKNYKTALPAVVIIFGVVVLLALLAARRIDASGFSVAATSLIGIGSFLIGMGAKDADK
jgi:hypothetical protein